MRKYGIIGYIAFVICILGMAVLYYRPLLQERFAPRTKVALVLNGSASDGSWCQAQYEAMEQVAGELKIQLVVQENASSDTGAETALFDTLVLQGCEIIIAGSYDFKESAQLAAAKYPDVTFFHVSGDNVLKNLSTCFGRMYQARYLAGIVAGLQTETNEIGYVAAYDMSEVNRGINAFTLGVRSVNPDAVVYVAWSNTWVDDELVGNAYERLKASHNIDVMTVHSDSLEVNRRCEQDGIWCIGYNRDNSAGFPNTSLTAAVWDWETFFEPQIRDCIREQFASGNYWQDLGSGMVGLSELTDNVKPGTAEKVREAENLLLSGTWDVFYGPLSDNTGLVRVEEGENMSDEALLTSFDWYVEGVVIDE